MKIAIYGKRHQTEYAESLQRFFNELARHLDDLEVVIEERFYHALTDTISLPEGMTGRFREADADADLALSLGGDGTFLRTANHIGALETPIMGINTGHLGFLSAFNIEDAAELVDHIVRSDYETEPRSVIAVEPSEKREFRRRPFALNEVAILKQDTASMITVNVKVDGHQLGEYHADGLLVSTPTGSTGYNLSVGGPIIDPQAPNWVISPIAAHSLTMRPLVISDDVEVEISVESRSGSYLLSIDGSSEVFPASTRLTLRAALYTVNVAHLPGHTFVDTLRCKMLWGK